MRKFLDHLYNGSLFLAGVFLVGIAVLMISESVVRKAGGYITGAGELVGWFSAAAGFLALPATFKRGDMVRVGMLLDLTKPGLRRVLLIFNLCVAAIFTVYMIWAVSLYIWDGWRYQELTQGMLEVPVWIPQISFLVGVVLLMVAIIDETIVHLRAPAESLHAERAAADQDISMHH